MNAEHGRFNKCPMFGYPETRAEMVARMKREWTILAVIVLVGCVMLAWRMGGVNGGEPMILNWGRGETDAQRDQRHALQDALEIKAGLGEGGYDGVQMDCFNKDEADMIASYLPMAERERVRFTWLEFERRRPDWHGLGFAKEVENGPH